MQSFRTTFEIKGYSPKLNYKSKSLFIGSCFTENIGNYLNELKLPVYINPTGIIYNPISICSSINYLSQGKLFEEKDLDFYNELYFSFDHHSRFSNHDKKICLENINKELCVASRFLDKTEFLFITLGSSYIYTHKERNKIIANCHKLPSIIFTKSLLNTTAIVYEFERTLFLLKKINPDIRIVFTVSPVRHWRDGAIENQRSKSVLISSIHEIIENNKNCFYFPAYELMMDDLRDYRFYAEDMIHPNSTAIEYIREKFIETFIDDESKDIMKSVMKLRRALEHRPFEKNSISYKKFMTDQLALTNELKSKFPLLDLQEFEDFFKGI